MRESNLHLRQTLKTVGWIYLLALATFVLDEAGWLKFPEIIHRLLFEIGVALLAVGSIHLLDHVSIIREVSGNIVKKTREMFDIALQGSTEKLTVDVGGEIKRASDSIVADVTTRTEKAFAEASQILQRQVESIKVMEESDLMAIYPSRQAAASAIRAGIAISKKVWLMGISLNEFCREERGPFLEAWEQLVSGIQAGEKKARLLLIDPYCHGAVLRSYSETANTSGVSDRLEGDVKAAARLLHQIRKDLGPQASLLEVRLYGTAPTMFLCHLDSSTFAQSYHFWKTRIAGCPIPVFQYRKRGQSQQGICIHTEMEQHFSFIWKHASVKLDELQESGDPDSPPGHFWPRPTRGLEWGAHASGMETVFIDRHRPAVRMQEEIGKSTRVWIQGITLRAFFDDSVLARTLAKRISSPNADIRIMLLDPDCDQAKVRAYREFLLNSDLKLSFEEFTGDHYAGSKLRRDLLETIARISSRHAGSGIKVAKYGTAPHMFVMIGDESAFVEQYSYGKMASSSPDDEVILGSDMPLIEYRRRIDPVYTRVLKEIRGEDNEVTEDLRPQPYPLLVDHFEYAWDQANHLKGGLLAAAARG